MDGNRLNKDSKFSLYVLIMAVAVIVGNAKLTVEGMNATLFALNYRRGIVARGLFGWILDVICSIFGERFYCYQTVFVICTLGYILYLVVMWIFAKKFIASYSGNKYAMAFIMLMTPFFVSMFATLENYGRTDMYLLLLSLVAGYFILKGKFLFLSVICPAVGILIHEGYVFGYYNIILACLFYMFAVGCEGKKRSRYAIWTVISIACSLFVFIWVFSLSKTLLPMTDEIYQGIVSDAERLALEGGEVHYDFLRAYVLGVDLYEVETDDLLMGRLSSVIFLVFFTPVIIKVIQVIRAVYKESAHKKTVIILSLGALTTLPLFIRKCDHGRWMFALVSYYLVMLCLLIIAENKVLKKVFLEQMQKTAKSGWEPIFYTAYFMVFIPFQTIVVDNFTQNAIVLFIRFMMGKYF